MISAWRFSIKSTLISTIRTDNNHTLTVRVTAFPPYALYVCTACSLPKAKRASMAERTLTLLLAWMKKWSDAYCVYPLPPPHARAAPSPRQPTTLALCWDCWHCWHCQPFARLDARVRAQTVKEAFVRRALCSVYLSRYYIKKSAFFRTDFW